MGHIHAASALIALPRVEHAHTFNNYSPHQSSNFFGGLCGRLVVIALVMASSGLSSQAVAAEPQARKSGADSACVDVEVDGYRGLSYDCLGQQLAGPERARGPNADIPASEMATRRAPNQMGLANKAAASNRMGSNFGRSALPQRPPAPIYTSPLPGPRP